ncbi:hypothetical protein [Nocardioides sp.]|uniref:hypothetical protein n=1 Tax=Nocardioides sp. TaxID=35761 RepID=UPI002633B738|nr:hypothetical protein [Nocardioides sp.]
MSATPQTVVASDLDRTLIYSASAAGGAEAVADARCVELYDGQPLSYVSAAAATAIAGLLDAGALVPVTTRTVAQFQRITLPGRAARFAVCANGGRLLVDGADDLDHRAHVTAVLAECAPLAEATAAFGRWCGEVATPDVGGAPRERDAEGLFCYAVFAVRAPDTAEIDRLGALMADLGWVVSAQGRKVYCTPRTLSKESALSYLGEVHRLTVAAVAGDSLLDAGMLARYGGWVPRDSELERRGFAAPGVALTAGSGLAAGEEILGRFGALVHRR